MKSEQRHKPKQKTEEELILQDIINELYDIYLNATVFKEKVDREPYSLSIDPPSPLRIIHKDRVLDLAQRLDKWKKRHYNQTP